MTGRSLGDVRPSQLITTFGPGAIVDLQTLSVIVLGTDHWETDEMRAVSEPRLQRLLGVDELYRASSREGESFFSRTGTIPVRLFPRWQVCTRSKCRALSPVGSADVEYHAGDRELRCKAPDCPGVGRRRATLVPAPFVIACPSGHLDDFPWRRYAHQGDDGCERRLRFRSTGRTGSVMDLQISCDCENGTRSMSDAFGLSGRREVGPCPGTRPWLRDSDREECRTPDDVRTIQRAATNGWFAVVQSALAIKEAASPIGAALRKIPARRLDDITSEEKVSSLITDFPSMVPSLVPFATRVEDVWRHIRMTRGDETVGSQDPRRPEWDVLRDPEAAESEQNEFVLESGAVPPDLTGLIRQVVLVRKLVEVRALTGFTRIETAIPGLSATSDDRIAPLSSSKPTWLPAVEVRGEGIFIELNEEAVRAWESRAAVGERASEMARRLSEWEAQFGGSTSDFPGARYILIHSLAHALIRQMSLDCGYSPSAIRERIYSSTDADAPMAGVLLYTASADSEGSLGGLVDLGSSDRLPQLVRGSLQAAGFCSSDPLCADHRPEAHGTINGAACHTCLLQSETSCESFNKLLDRTLVVPTVVDGSRGFFPGQVVGAHR